ncbi:spermine synthase [Radiobacillus sp. PE A8.2]|uniref:spermine synthase n=1 Tax=Radiobacillus sp. PE A8.2 TaxID=3380349 RepID=UPI00388DC246
MLDLISVWELSMFIIVYEIFLSRFFSVLLDYNYVFIVVSMVTLGLGVGGYIAHKREWFLTNYRQTIIVLFPCLMLGLVTMVYLMSYTNVVVYFLLLTIPFIIGGGLLANYFQTWQKHPGKLYFVDLIGAGFGVVVTLWLMDVTDPFRTIAVISLLVIVTQLPIIIIQKQKVVLFTCSVIIFLLAINLFNPIWTTDRFQVYKTSPYTSFSNEKAEIIASSWDALSRTDIYDAEDNDFLYITIDGGAVSSISKFNGDFTEVDYLKQQTSYLAFSGKERGKALIIGAGGGQDILSAKMAGYEKVEAVDINESSFTLLNKLSAFSGDVLNLPGVKPIVADGRNYARETTSQYDLIYLSLVTKKAENGLGMGLSENYIYTQEAILDYLDILSPNGKLAFLLHDEAELAKIIHSLGQAFSKQGLDKQDIAQRIAIVGTNHVFGYPVGGNKLSRPLVLVQKTPFDKEDSQKLHKQVLETAQNPVHIPNELDRYSALKDYLTLLDLDLEANRDGRPFFYYKDSGIPKELILSLLSVLLLIGLLTWWKRKEVPFSTYIYMAGIGIGFIMIEVTLIQQLILPLGHPTLSFAIVLGVLLPAGGIGSFCYKRWDNGTAKKFHPLIWVFVSTLVVSSLITLYYMGDIHFPLTYRVVLIILILFPLSFFMGMPFPFLLGRMNKDIVPLAWGINGLWTVIGSLLASILSLQFGFQPTLLIGGFIYLFLYFVPLR